MLRLKLLNKILLTIQSNCNYRNKALLLHKLVTLQMLQSKKVKVLSVLMTMKNPHLPNQQLDSKILSIPPGYQVYSIGDHLDNNHLYSTIVIQICLQLNLCSQTQCKLVIITLED
jgi:hypothetical protein